MDDTDPPSPAAFLSLANAADLVNSGLSSDTIRDNHFYSTEIDNQAKRILGWNLKGRKRIGLGLVIPFLDLNGQNTGYARFKPDTPRLNKEGKPQKYESPIGRGNVAYFPSSSRAAILDPAAPILITEGEKKACKASQEGFPCIGLVGVYGWCKPRQKKDGKSFGAWRLIDSLSPLNWRGRSVYIVFDSDAVTNENVRLAEMSLAETITTLGAAVKIVRLPEGPPGIDGKPAKVGLDDYLIAHGRDALQTILAQAVASPFVTPESPSSDPNDIAEAMVGDGVSPIAPKSSWEPSLNEGKPNVPDTDISQCKNRRRLTYEDVTGKRVKGAEYYCGSLACETCNPLKRAQICAAVRIHLDHETEVYVFRMDADKWGAGYKSIFEKAKRKGLPFKYMAIESDHSIFVMTDMTPPQASLESRLFPAAEAAERFCKAVGRMKTYGEHDYTSSRDWSIERAFPKPDRKANVWRRSGSHQITIAEISDIAEAFDLKSRIFHQGKHFPSRNIVIPASDAVRPDLIHSIRAGQKLSKDEVDAITGNDRGVDESQWGENEKLLPDDKNDAISGKT